MAFHSNEENWSNFEMKITHQQRWKSMLNMLFHAEWRHQWYFLSIERAQEWIMGIFHFDQWTMMTFKDPALYLPVLSFTTSPLTKTWMTFRSSPVKTNFCMRSSRVSWPKRVVSGRKSFILILSASNWSPTSKLPVILSSEQIFADPLVAK